MSTKPIPYSVTIIPTVSTSNQQVTLVSQALGPVIGPPTLARHNKNIPKGYSHRGFNIFDGFTKNPVLLLFQNPPANQLPSGWSLQQVGFAGDPEFSVSFGPGSQSILGPQGQTTWDFTVPVNCVGVIYWNRKSNTTIHKYTYQFGNGSSSQIVDPPITNDPNPEQ